MIWKIDIHLCFIKNSESKVLNNFPWCPLNGRLKAPLRVSQPIISPQSLSIVLTNPSYPLPSTDLAHQYYNDIPTRVRLQYITESMHIILFQWYGYNTWHKLTKNYKCIPNITKMHQNRAFISWDILNFPEFVNSLRPSDAYMCRWTRLHWFRSWLVAWMTPSHYLNQCWSIVNWTLRNKRQWNFNRNSYVSFKKMHLKMLPAKWWPFCLSLNLLNGKFALSQLSWKIMFKPWTLYHPACK